MSSVPRPREQGVPNAWGTASRTVRAVEERSPLGLTLLFLFNFRECGYSTCASELKKKLKTSDCFVDVKQNGILAVNRSFIGNLKN